MGRSIEELVEWPARGSVTGVEILLSSVAAGLAVQLALIAVG